MLKYCLAAAVAAAGLASPALAQDAEPVAAKPSEFTGFKVEGLAGYDEGVVYGVAAGYDHQFGRLVLGGEAELSDSTDKDCLTNAFAPGDRFCSIVGRNIYAGGRVGFAVAPRTLLYGKIGYTNQRAIVDYTAGTPAALDSFRVSADIDGIRLGGGIEQKIGRNAYVKGEYRYSDYENNDFRHSGVVGIGFRF
jgi:outer membrane immunogenic protein